MKRETVVADKIKVLHFVGSMNKGGVESIVLNYSKALKNDVEPTFVCFDDSKEIPIEEINSIGGHYFIVPHVKHLGKFKKAFKKILTENHFDIIHSHINTLSVFTLKVAKQAKYPIRIAHSHSQSSKNEFLRNMVKNFLRKFSKKYATFYIACGEIAGRYQFGNKAYDNGEVHIVKNAIDIAKFAYSEVDRLAVRKELNIPENTPVVGNIGRLCQTKNQTYVLSIAKKMPETHFVIVGGGPLQEDLEKAIKENNLHNVHLAGTTENTARYYSAFDAFILPSLYEGVPVTGIEAQANGVYVIFSNNVPKESMVSTFGEFLPIGDENIDKWVESLSNVRQHEDHTQEVINSGFSINEASNNLLQIYKSLLSK